MFIFVIQTLQKRKWNEISMKQLAGGKHMENDCFPRTLKFEMWSSMAQQNQDSTYSPNPLLAKALVEELMY
jgi:hypothetical protein